MKTTPAKTLCALLLFLAAAGCGGGSTPNCSITELSVAPQSAVANHASAAPGNQQQFIAGPVLPKGCIPPPLPFAFATWSVSDPINVSISNLKDQTNGTATCTGATTGPATITATTNAGQPGSGGPAATGTATLTCN